MVQIRKAYPTDAYTLVQVTDTVWKNEFYDVLPHGILYQMVQNIEKRVAHLRDQIIENNRIFVALEDEKIVGFVFYAKAFNDVDSASAEIRSIYVLPEFQKCGIGKMLMEEAINEVKRIGFKSLFVYCPLDSRCIGFFSNMGGELREVLLKDINGYRISCQLLSFDLLNEKVVGVDNEWNDIYLTAQENLYLLNDINREVAVIMADSGNIYLGLGIKTKVCPIESALSNMYLAQEKVVRKILILNRQSKPVLPCGKCRDLLIGLGQDSAEILFDFGTLTTMTMKELNPYYKDEEKV